MLHSNKKQVNYPLFYSGLTKKRKALRLFSLENEFDIRLKCISSTNNFDNFVGNGSLTRLIIGEF